MWKWFWPRQQATRQVVVYTRDGCHLCDDALALLQKMSRDFPLAIECVNVDTDPELVHQYGNEVPVVLIDGQVRFRGRINLVLLRRLLRAGQ